MEDRNHINWDEFFMGVAKLACLRSKDPSTKVGACIVSPDNKILSTGYNGAPIGISDSLIPWDSKEGNFLEIKNTYVIHAEANAIYNYSGDKRNFEGSRIYVELFPCHQCALAIIQNKITEVIYFHEYKQNDSAIASRWMLEQAGVMIRKFETDLVESIDINFIDGTKPHIRKRNINND